MNKIGHRICVHCAVLYLLTLCVGLFVVAGWLPPVAPGVEGDEVTSLFDRDRTQIRIGVTILVGSALFWWPFSAAVSTQMRRIEGKHAVFAPVQLAAASGISLTTIFAGYAWLLAAYRDDAPTGVVQIFSDFAWLAFVGVWPPAMVQSLAVALCILTTKGAQDVYPRWVGYASLWMTFIYLPGALAPFFHDGPLAWNGVITFWTVATAYFGYIVMMWWMTARAIDRWADESDELPASAVVG